MERCTMIVNARDRFSTTTQCLETLFANTPEPFDLIVVMGGAPEHLKRAWQERFGESTRFIFRPTFLNQAQARNLGLQAATTRLAVCMDNDNFVRPGWLTALITCQQDTGAVMIVPLILETERKIHTAGNDLYISYHNGRGFGYKHLRFHSMLFDERSNLQRQRTDYSELHCQLVEVEPTLRLGAYDEQILEVGEVDQGLTFAKVGRAMWFEPASVVHFALGHPLAVEDIRLFAWRWNIRAIHEGYQYFQRKWDFDISEYGTFRDWLVRYNSQLGLLPRVWPSKFSLQMDRGLGQIHEWVVDLCLAPKYRYERFRKRQLGYYDWTAGVTPRNGA